MGEVSGSKTDRIQGSEVLGSRLRTSQPAPAQDLRAKRGEETGDGQALTEQGRGPWGNGPGVGGQTDRDSWAGGHGDMARPAGALGERTDGLLRSGHPELGMWTVRLAWMCQVTRPSDGQCVSAPVRVCVCAHADRQSVPASMWGLRMCPCVMLQSFWKKGSHSESMSVRRQSLCERLCLFAHTREATWVSPHWAGGVSLGCLACLRLRIGRVGMPARQVRPCLHGVRSLLLLLLGLGRGPGWGSWWALGWAGGCPQACVCVLGYVCQEVSCICVSLSVMDFGGSS